MIKQPDPVFLFSIDLEDIRFRMSDGERYAERVPLLTENILDFLEVKKAKCTFFVVGDVAKKYPELVKSIVMQGHEIACHSDTHITLNNFNPQAFKDDLKRNMEHLNKAGAEKLYGFRAPRFSLTDKTQWAYEVLAELGFLYSSSVLPANNPIHGWPGFGIYPKQINNSIWEMPISLLRSPLFTVPFAGGTYFRVLPFGFIKNAFQSSFKNSLPVLSYFHPYDFDSGQERFMHPDIENNKFFNYLLYYNRKNTFNRIDKILNLNCKIIPYIDFVKTNLLTGVK